MSWFLDIIAIIPCNIILASCEPHLFTVKSAAQFARPLKQCNECYCFMLSFTYHIAHYSGRVCLS